MTLGSSLRVPSTVGGVCVSFCSSVTSAIGQSTIALRPVLATAVAEVCDPLSPAIVQVNAVVEVHAKLVQLVLNTESLAPEKIKVAPVLLYGLPKVFPAEL